MMTLRNLGIATFAMLFILAGCTDTTSGSGEDTVDAIAEEFVVLALSLGRHDGGYVDAYFGPESLADLATERDQSLENIIQAATALAQRVAALSGSATDSDTQARLRYLDRHLVSMIARIDVINGESMSFDQEARRIYDSKPARYPDSTFQEVLDQIDALLPGAGSLTDRYNTYRDQFIIPADALDEIFHVAIDECRRRTLQYIDLPANEDFTIEYVTDKPWSGYNWYQGNAVSLIQLNTELPVYIDRAVDLACHEGYPGHHVYSTLRDVQLYRGRGWIEFAVSPLFGPQGPIAEGSANYGIEVAFPGGERLAFEKTELFPRAGLDPGAADRYYRLLDLLMRLNFAHNEAARRYLDGELDVGQTVAYLMRYGLMSEAKARQRVRFIDTYRSYVINYNYGKELVADYISRSAVTPEERWAALRELLSGPFVPSDLE